MQKDSCWRNSILSVTKECKFTFRKIITTLGLECRYKLWQEKLGFITDNNQLIKTKTKNYLESLILRRLNYQTIQDCVGHKKKKENLTL